jgi:hypothetical protein
MKFNEIQEACWTGYRQAGMKKKGDRQVPNCVPVEEVKTGPEITGRDLLFKAAAMAIRDASHEGISLDYEQAIRQASKLYGIPYQPSELPRLLAQRAEIDRQLALLKQGKQVARARRQEKRAPTPAGTDEYWKTHALPTDRIKPASKTLEAIEEDLKKWFKEKWVRFGPDGRIRGDCARGSEGEGKPKCLPQSKAHSLGKKGRASAAAKKRREDPNPERRGPAKNVATRVKEQYTDDDDWYDDKDQDTELRSGDYVRDTMDGEYGEIFRMQGDPYERRVRILDRDGKGWYIEPSRLTRVDPTDPDVQRYFGKKRVRDMDEGPAVDAYMAGKSPAIAHYADQLDRIASKTQGVAENRPEDLPGIDYDRPGDVKRKTSSGDHNPYPYSREEDDDYFREIFRKKREAAAKAKAPGGSLNEFAPGQGGGSGNYFQALASAWYNGAFDTGSLQKGIKSKEDVERLLQRGVLCPDGVTRKYGIDYNAEFDGVVISSDDYYEHSDYNDKGQEVDSRTGQLWGPYDYMEFSDDDLSESLNELSTEKLAQYKTVAALDAGAADKAGNYERGNKRFSGIVKATKKQFANDLKKHKDPGVAEAVTLDRNRVPDYPRDPATVKHRTDTAKAILSDPRSDPDSRRQASAILTAIKQIDEKQDACYNKVKSRYKVWPSAYASGALVQCRKKGAANWGNKKK